MSKGCGAHQEGNIFVCTDCGCSWPVNGVMPVSVCSKAQAKIYGVKPVTRRQCRAEAGESCTEPACNCPEKAVGLSVRVFPEDPTFPANILRAAAQTYEQRNAGYKDNYKKVGAVMQAFFPEGVTLSKEQHHRVYHLFELMVVKLTRFVNSDFTHKDSIHDSMVYAAMIEMVINEGGLK